MAIDSFKNKFAFLSNFYPCDVMYEEVMYGSVEHAYVASKSTSPVVRSHVLTIPTAGEVKKFGRTIQLRPAWEHLKFGIMLDLVHYKFNHNKELADKLMATGERELIEGNFWHDIEWGYCWGKCKTPHEPMGANKLGVILMSVRRTLPLSGQGQLF